MAQRRRRGKTAFVHPLATDPDRDMEPSLMGPWRILFAFDPNRAAILLVGGNKRGDKRWYKKHLPIADERFRRHLERLEQ
jgi:hypothetical protein